MGHSLRRSARFGQPPFRNRIPPDDDAPLGGAKSLAVLNDSEVGGCVALATRQVYRFGSFRLDVEQRLLLRGSERVALRPRVFDTLLVLVERHGEVVTKEELLDAVWPDTV